MGLAARVEERAGRPPRISYRWDTETDILTGAVKGTHRAAEGGGLSGSVELEGSDGSFILLDVQDGAIRGVEVVVWPDVRTVQTLQPPGKPRAGDVVLPIRKAGEVLAALEVDTALTIETNPGESVFRIRVGPSRRVEAVHVADGLLVEVDEKGEIAGFWLTGVPPFPADEPA
jgi:uncharacterized protein YuzE